MVSVFFPRQLKLCLRDIIGSDACYFVSGGKVPADKYTIVTRREHIEPGAFFTVCAGGSIGILIASFFLGFNLYHRKLK